MHCLVESEQDSCLMRRGINKPETSTTMSFRAVAEKLHKESDRSGKLNVYSHSSMSSTTSGESALKHSSAIQYWRKRLLLGDHRGNGLVSQALGHC